MSLSYRQLQSALKTAKANGIKVNVKLNSKQQVLQAEYDRIRAATVQEFATKVKEQQEPTQNAEVEQLKQELAEAQAKIQEQQATIEKLQQELDDARKQQETNEEDYSYGSYEYGNYCDYEEPQPEPQVETDEMTPEKAEALDINGKIIWDAMEYLGKHGKKATIQWLKQMSPKFHSDTCANHGNKFNIWQWQGYINIITMVKNDELEPR